MRRSETVRDEIQRLLDRFPASPPREEAWVAQEVFGGNIDRAYVEGFNRGYVCGYRGALRYLFSFLHAE